VGERGGRHGSVAEANPYFRFLFVLVILGERLVGVKGGELLLVASSEICRFSQFLVGAFLSSRNFWMRLPVSTSPV
jgi:hypothetical protein